MDESLRQLVWDRAAHACEYCRLPQRFDNPRRDNWNEHFVWNGPELVGRTAIGRTTIDVLNINLPERVEYRRLLIQAGVLRL